MSLRKMLRNIRKRANSPQGVSIPFPQNEVLKPDDYIFRDGDFRDGGFYKKTKRTDGRKA